MTKIIDIKEKPDLCQYCGINKATYYFKTPKKWCCSKYTSRCPSMKRKKGSSDETKDNLRKKILEKINDPNSIYNSIEYKKKIGEKTKDLWKNEEYRLKQSESRTGLKRSNKFKKEQSDRFKGHINGRVSSKQIQKRYPTFAKIEEMRYEPGKEKEKVIQVHCKNHKCKNSKEKGGWFTPKNRDQFYCRVWSIEKNTFNSYYYCSDECKQECPLYGKTVNQIIKQDQILAGIIKEDLYTSEEYQTFRQQVLIREDYKCEYCDEPANHVHHSRPQKLEPGFVLDPDFGVACCENCHYKYGHKTGTECSTGNLANKSC